jgi:hypothetical protein
LWVYHFSKRADKDKIILIGIPKYFGEPASILSDFGKKPVHPQN